MSQSSPTNMPPEIICKKNLQELTELLVKDAGLSEGFYDLAVDFNINIGAFGPSQDKAFPGVAATVGGIGLVKSPVMGPFSADASKVNKPKRKRIV